MGNLAKLFTPYYEEGFIQDYSIRFRGMVFLGDVITLKAELKERVENRMSFEVQAINQEGGPVLKGKVVYLLLKPAVKQT
jgi:acyl dehydratase